MPEENNSHSSKPFFDRGGLEAIHGYIENGIASRPEAINDINDNTIMEDSRTQHQLSEQEKEKE